MQKNLPFFPLSLVVYPEERLNLHIFEPRYRQLINECHSQNSSFGIPVFLDNKVSDYGTEVRIISIAKRYEDGRMDIQIRGMQPFKLLNFQNPIPKKLYAGGEVQILDIIKQDNFLVRQKVIELITVLYDTLKINLDMDFESIDYLSYAFAHKIGLSFEQQYQLLQIQNEEERQNYILEHLEHSIPIVAEMEQTKDLIRMNGHFRNYNPLEF